MGLGNGSNEWKFIREKKREVKSGEKRPLTIKDALSLLRKNINPNDDRSVISMGNGDPSTFNCFRTAAAAEDAVVDALHSARFNGYTLGSGHLPAKEAVAEYISRDLPYKLSLDDVHLTVGCKQAIQATITALTHPDSNILLPKPTYPLYDANAAFNGLEVRHYDLLPEEEWKVDLSSVKALADDNTVAIVIINPGNPCGTVYTRRHLREVAETARDLELLVIADEMYEHITFGSNPFVRMGVFASIEPVLTLGAISKRWLVPGWRLGWLVTTDPNNILQKSMVLQLE